MLKQIEEAIGECKGWHQRMQLRDEFNVERSTRLWQDRLHRFRAQYSLMKFPWYNFLCWLHLINLGRMKMSHHTLR